MPSEDFEEEKVKALTQEERDDIYRDRFDIIQREKHEEPVGTVNFPGFTHNSIQILKEKVLPELDQEQLNVIEVGVGKNGVSPYQFAHVLEKEGKDFHITATDMKDEVLESSKNLKEISKKTKLEDPERWSSGEKKKEEMKNKEEFDDFMQEVKYKDGKLEIPERWKKDIDFEKSNMFYSAPREQADIVNCSKTLYFYRKPYTNLAFMNLVDMVKPGGFLHTDMIPTNEEYGKEPVSSEERLKEVLDFDSYGLELKHVEGNHAIFKKKE